MNKNVIYLIIALISISCGKKFLDREPSYFSNKTNAYGSIQAVRSALNGCYDGLQDYRYYGRNLFLLTEVYTDNAKLSSTNLNNFSSFYSYSVTSSSAELDGLWKLGYKIIARTNNVIDATLKLTKVSYIEKRQILGEAYAIRALVYFDLVRLFAQPYTISSGVDSANGKGGHAGIPIITTPTSEDSLIFPVRSAVNTVYNQILTDFYKADTMLVLKSSEPYTLCSYAVKSLLSRVYMTMGIYSEVIGLSYNLIKSNQYSLLENEEYVSSWKLAYTTESIFSISMTLNDNNGTNSIGYMLSKSGYGDIVSTNDLYNLFGENDARKTLYQKGKDIFLTKYPGRISMSGVDNIPIIRYTEIYLNYAEAALRNTNFSLAAQNLARTLLDTLLKRSDNKAIPIQLQGNDLLNFILEERRKEFAFEGQRYFDIKRLQSSINRNDCNSTVCNVSYPSYLYAFPIPISEINANNNIKQNPGY